MAAAAAAGASAGGSATEAGRKRVVKFESKLEAAVAAGTRLMRDLVNVICEYLGATKLVLLDTVWRGNEWCTTAELYDSDTKAWAQEASMAYGSRCGTGSRLVFVERNRHLVLLGDGNGFCACFDLNAHDRDAPTRAAAGAAGAGARAFAPVSYLSQAQAGGWTLLPDMTVRRASYVACSVGAYVYVFGDTDPTAERVEVKSAAERLVPADQQKALGRTHQPHPKLWTELKPLPHGPRQGLSCAVANDKIYVIGGQTASASASSYLYPPERAVHVFDTRALSWNAAADTIPDFPATGKALVPDDFVPRRDRRQLETGVMFASAATWHGLIAVVGGLTSAEASAEPTGQWWTYSFGDRQWTVQASRLNHARSHHLTTVLNEQLFVFGGWDTRDQAGTSVERFDAAKGVWSVMPRMMHPHQHVIAAAIS